MHMTNLYQYMRPLIEAGYVYAACPPLFKVAKKKGKREEVTYLYTNEELNAMDTTGCTVQRYKGLRKPSPYQFFRLISGVLLRNKANEGRPIL